MGPCPAREAGQIREKFRLAGGRFSLGFPRSFFGIFRIGVEVVGHFMGRNAVILVQPFAQIDIGAAFGTERPVFGHFRFVADGTGPPFERHDLGTGAVTHGITPP